MAITDINISEELQTNAPSIKYRGNEGPKSPEQQEQALLMRQLRAEYERYVAQANPSNVLSFEDWYRMSIEQQAQTRGPRAMAAYGGIMGVDGRRQYGLGSSLKKFVRKVIPNEVSDIAVKAAPFVAPFNPIAAGLMSGIGGFDQHGSISKGLKSGLMNYGMGQVARGIGGAGMQEGFNLKINPNATGLGQYFSSPMAAASAATKTVPQQALTSQGDYTLAGQKVSEMGSPNLIENVMGKIGEYVPTSFSDLTDPKKILGALGIYKGAEALLGGPEETVSEIMERGEGLDVEGIRAEVIEAYKDPSGEKLKALRSKYPFLGKREDKDLSQFAMGGRIGRAEGGLMDLGGMEKDYRAEGGFVPIGAKEKADDVPARLSVNEFVFTADAVRNAGGGDIDKGAEVMENMMKNLEAGGQVSEESQGLAGAQQMFETSERLSEVI